MEEEKKFLSIEELTKQSHDFKKKWYGLAKKAEGLTDYKNGFEEGFKKNIKSIYDDVDACKDYVDGLEDSLKHYFPAHRSDVTWMTKKVFRHLEDLRVMVKKDYDVLENSKDLAESLKALTDEREKAEAKLKKSEKESGDACRKYFDMKNEYTAEHQAIEDKINKKLDKIQGKFEEMTTPIVEGHDISIGSRKVTIEELFEHLSEKPEDAEKINLAVKKGGLFGKKVETDVAKTSVLKYVSGEILEGVPPIQKEKKKLINELKNKYSELPKLEKACEEAEKKRKKLEKPLEEARSKINEIKKSEVFKFVDYDGILETREQYLDKIKSAEKDVKDYLDFALLNLEGFVELESDVEKRNLLTEVREAKKKAEDKEKEASKAREELSSKVKELTKVTALKEDLEKKIKSAVEKEKKAQDEVQEMKKKTSEVSKRIGELEKIVQDTFKKLESEVESKLSEITAAMETGKKAAEEKKVGKKVDTLRGKKK